VLDAASDSTTINKLLGIPSVDDGIANNKITLDESCTNIAVGQVLLILDNNNRYVHAAIYEGNGIFSTKNGQGDGSTGVEHMSLQQIKDIYYNWGGVKSAFIDSPTKTASTSGLGANIGANGFASKTQITNALTNCACN